MRNRRCISDFFQRLLNRRRNLSTIQRQPTLDENGSALIEFTIMAPLLFMIVFGIIEWGSIFWLQNNMQNASREAARTAAMVTNTALTSTQVMTSASQTACNWLTGSKQTYTVTAVDLCTAVNSATQDVRVSVNIDAAQASLFNYLGMFTGVKFTTAATMRKELNCPGPGAGATVTCTCNATGATPSGC